jgi:hypothetical protein
METAHRDAEEAFHRRGQAATGRPHEGASRLQISAQKEAETAPTAARTDRRFQQSRAGGWDRRRCSGVSSSKHRIPHFPLTTLLRSTHSFPSLIRSSRLSSSTFLLRVRI